MADKPLILPGLKDDKELLFVEEYVRTNDPLVAVTHSGIRDLNGPIEITAQRLLARPEIRAAIDKLRKMRLNAEAIQIRHTRDSLIASIQNVHDRAMMEKDYGTALNAMKEVGTLLGLRVEKKEVTVDTRPENMRTADIVKLLQEIKGKQYIEVEAQEDQNAEPEGQGAASS